MNNKFKISMLLDFYGQLLSQKQSEIMKYYYNDDLSLREISEIIGITRQGVHDTIKRSDAFLEELEDKLGLYDKWQNIQSDLHIIEISLKNIYSENCNDCHNSYVSENCCNAMQAISDIKNKF